MALHCVWNTAATISGFLTLLMLPLWFAFVAAFLGILIGLVVRKGRIIRAHLQDEVLHGQPHARGARSRLLARSRSWRATFSLGRRRGRRFVRTATRLGLSKWHAGARDGGPPANGERGLDRPAASRALRAARRDGAGPRAAAADAARVGARTCAARRAYPPAPPRRSAAAGLASIAVASALRSDSLGALMLDARSLLNAAVDYIRRNPDELVRAAVNAAGLRFGVPLAALRYLSSQAKLPRKAPKDIEIGSSPPAIRISLSVDAMGTPVRASAAIKIDEIDLSPEAMRIGIKLSDVKLALIGDSNAPVATLIKSGALDLSKPGNLVKFLPKRPPAIVEADEDRIVVDLMKVPAVASNEVLRRALAIVTPVVNVRAVETDRDHLYVALRASPRGLPRAFAALRGAR